MRLEITIPVNCNYKPNETISDSIRRFTIYVDLEVSRITRSHTLSIGEVDEPCVALYGMDCYKIWCLEFTKDHQSITKKIYRQVKFWFTSKMCCINQAYCVD